MASALNMPNTGSHEFRIQVVPFEANSEFNDYLDEIYGKVVIEGHPFRSSLVLHTMDPEAYADALRQFSELQSEKMKSVVSDKFPTLIAYSFALSEDGFQNDIHRLHLLRDVWESLIALLFAITVGEYLCAGIAMESQKATAANILGYKIRTRIEIVRDLVLQAERDGHDMISRKLISPSVLEDIITLNDTRNIFSHGLAVTNQQALRFYVESYQELLPILQEFTRLRDVTLLRFVTSQGFRNGMLEAKFERFVGHAMIRRHKTLHLSPAQQSTCVNCLNDQHIFAWYEEKLICLSPFLHFVERDGGNTTRLCRFKRKAPNQPQLFLYDVLGDSAQEQFPSTCFEGQLDMIEHLAAKPRRAVQK